MRDHLALKILGRSITAGRLEVTHPDGRRSVLEGSEPGHSAAVQLYADGVIVSALLGGATGLLEAYMDGQFDTDDLAEFLLFAASNQQAWVERNRRWYEAGRRITGHRRHDTGPVETMAGHYNLGNEFYATWLDPSMTYSAARFDDDRDDLAAAQATKYDRLVALADIEAGHEVLEIGSGWGGFAVHLALLGCRVTTLTIAEEQLAYVKARVEAEGLGDFVDARLLDFADVRGTFDRVVSIEMIESIDEQRWPELFSVIARSLRPGGKLGMQAIIIDDAFWESYRSNPDFIQRYIFPGGKVPAPGLLRELVTGAGLAWEHDERFGDDYARTLRSWHSRFDAAWPEIAGQGFDQRFRRMWKSYLAYCEAGFTVGRLDVMQFTAS